MFESKKPAFFTRNQENTFYLVDTEKKNFCGTAHKPKDINIMNDDKNELYNIITKEKKLIEANSCLIENFYKIKLDKNDVKDINFCYVGDAFNTDCLQAVKRDTNWFTIGVSDSLVTNTIRKQHDEYSDLWGGYFQCLDYDGNLRSSYFNKIIRENFSILIPNVAFLQYFDIKKENK